MSSVHWAVAAMTFLASLSIDLIAGDFYVDPAKGDDKANGLSAEQAAGSGPVKSLSKGLKLVKAGDTLHLAKTTYHETLQLNDTTGEAGKPIIIDGHGSTITGCDPLRLNGWIEVSPGLYKSEKFISELQESDDPARLMRVFILVDGKIQHMGRTSKGKKLPFKKPDELQPGEWTADEASKTFYIKVSGKLEDAKIEAPYRMNGVAIHGGRGGVHHVIIRNLVCTHVLNDGFNLHGKCSDVVFENIAAYENGDDGYSAHDNCESTVNGFRSSGNSTGVANINESATKFTDVVLEGNFGFEFLAGYNSTWEIRNMVVAVDCTEPFMLGYGRPEESKFCRVKMENVQISSPVKSSFQVKIKKNCILEAKNITSTGAPWLVEGSAKISDSIISAQSLECTADAKWESDNNSYYLMSLTFKGKKYGPADFQEFQKDSKSDMNSKCLPFSKDDLEKLLNPGPKPAIGADISAMKIPARGN